MMPLSALSIGHRAAEDTRASRISFHGSTYVHRHVKAVEFRRLSGHSPPASIYVIRYANRCGPVSEAGAKIEQLPPAYDLPREKGERKDLPLPCATCPCLCPVAPCLWCDKSHIKNPKGY